MLKDADIRLFCGIDWPGGFGSSMSCETSGPFRPEGGTYVLGDHKGLTEEQMVMMDGKDAVKMSLGPVGLHTDQCVVIIHNRLDIDPR